jgi:hypothetical protein
MERERVNKFGKGKQVSRQGPGEFPSDTWSQGADTGGHPGGDAEKGE